jgi:hypothetical protein
MGILNKIDRVICSYLGLTGQEDDRPKAVSVINDTLFIVKNLPFQRHKSYETLKSFSEASFPYVDEDIRLKIGAAAGQAIAKNLAISFYKIDINND